MFGRVLRLSCLINDIAPCSRGMKSLVPMIKWVRPEIVPRWKPECSGDLEKIQTIPRDTLVPMFNQFEKDIEKLHSVKQLFTVGFHGRMHVRSIMLNGILDRVRRFESDTCTREARIAWLTGRIRMMQNHLEKYPRDTFTRVKCKEAIDKRHTKLSYLKRWDCKRYEWVLDKLNIVHKTVPEQYEKVTRKQSMIKLTDLYCDSIRKKKMDDYKMQLERERHLLLKEYQSNPLPPPDYVHKFDEVESN